VTVPLILAVVCADAGEATETIRGHYCEKREEQLARFLLENCATSIWMIPPSEKAELFPLAVDGFRGAYFFEPAIA